MPNGKSFYAGTGSNKSLVSRSDFVSSLQARRGGMFKGPTGGYPVELHGTELIIPVTPDSILTKLVQDTPNAEKIVDDIIHSVSKTTKGEMPDNEMNDFLEMDNQMKEMLVGKLNKMIDVLDNKQSTSKKQFRAKIAG